MLEVASACELDGKILSLVAFRKHSVVGIHQVIAACVWVYSMFNVIQSLC